MSFKLASATACYITCETALNGENITISGQIANATGKNQVTLLVGEPDNILYVNQTESGTDGKFIFEFKMKSGTESGVYNFKVGSDSGASPYSGTLNYNSNTVAVRNKIMDVYLNLNIIKYEPNVSGLVYCTEDKSIHINLLNKTDNEIIYTKTISSEDNSTKISFGLPSLLRTKKYELTVSCTDSTGKTLTDVKVDIDSKVLALQLDALVNTANNVEVEATMQSATIEELNDTTVFSGNEQLSFTTPNIISNAHIYLELEGFETVYTDFVYNGTYTKTVNKYREKFSIAVNAYNLDKLSDKTFTVLYPHNNNELLLDDLCKFTGEKETEAGVISGTDITILEHKPGYIRFKVNEAVPTGKLLTKTVNLIGFMGIETGEHIIEFTVQGDRLQ